MTDSEKMTNRVLEGIATGVKNYLQGNIPEASIYSNEQFVSFSFYVEEVQDVASVSLYSSNNSFHGNLTNGGYFTGTYTDSYVNAHSSDSGISASVYY